MRFTKVGMRTIKTVIAVIITLGIAEIFKLRSPILAAIASIMTMEGSVSESFNTGKHRMYGTILGGIVALLISAIAPESFFFIGLGLILIINLCNVFDWNKSARISMVVFLIIILNYKDGDGLSYAINRTLDTLVGVIVGTAINYFIRPPKIEEKIKEILDDIELEVREILENLIWKNEYNSLENLKEEINNIENDYKVFIEDTKFHIGKSDNIVKYKEIFNSYENIRNHLRVINSIKELPNIKEENREYLEKYFSKKIPKQNYIELDDLDLIYNFHLDKILCELQYIENLKVD